MLYNIILTNVNIVYVYMFIIMLILYAYIQLLPRTFYILTCNCPL